MFPLKEENQFVGECIYMKGTKGSAGFPSAHALWCRPFSVHFKLHATIANSANMQVSLGVRSHR